MTKVASKMLSIHQIELGFMDQLQEKRGVAQGAPLCTTSSARILEITWYETNKEETHYWHESTTTLLYSLRVHYTGTTFIVIYFTNVVFGINEHKLLLKRINMSCYGHQSHVAKLPLPQFHRLTKCKDVDVVAL